MEIISNSNFKTNRIKYFGEGADFALIYFKNIILIIITFGLYYPWAKVEMLNYHYQTTELDNSRFQFHATGEEVFKGFIKIYIILISLFIIYLYSSSDLGLGPAIIYLPILFLIPLAIHGALRYRSSRSSWKGIYFKYNGNRTELFKIFLRGVALSVLTFGIYLSWFKIEIRKYIFKNFHFGNLDFTFKGKGSDLFWIELKFNLLIIPTLGIYYFWYISELYKYYVNNTFVIQDNKEIPLKFKMNPVDVFELVIVNILLIIFTFGLATPWVKVRTLSFFYKFAEIDGHINTENIQQAKYDDYDDAAGDDFLDFLDFDLI